MLGFIWFLLFSFENCSLKLFPVFGKVALLLFGLAHHISQSDASPFVMEIWRNQHPYWGLGLGQLASRRYPRQREYPHPPPPSRNNTRRTINMVVISHLLSGPEQCRLGTKAECVRTQGRNPRLPQVVRCRLTDRGTGRRGKGSSSRLVIGRE